jgi:murein DD-endopeptidase MepM/ murein hydrolase activator NlpD
MIKKKEIGIKTVASDVARLLIADISSPPEVVFTSFKNGIASFDDKFEVFKHSEENGEIDVYQAINESVDIAEVIWELKHSVFDKDFLVNPGHAGRKELIPGVRGEFLRLTKKNKKALLPEFTDTGSSLRFSIGSSRARRDTQFLYALPFRGDPNLSQGFNGSFSHTDATNRFATDFDLPLGSPVLVARDGLVVALENNQPDNPSKLPSSIGNLVLIRHDDFTYGMYAHLKKGSVNVKLGENVSVSKIVARSGSSGYVRAPHLHFAVLESDDRGGFTSLQFRFKNASGQAITPQEGKRPSEW